MNGITDLNLTKLDVLSGFESVKIGTKYLIDGQEVVGMPASLRTYSSVQMLYEEMPGWKEDISQCKSFDELPPNCKAYILRLEQLLGMPIRWIGVGPGRADIIEK